jgi:plastocyanin
MGRIWHGAVVTWALALVALGCGGSDAPKSSGSPAPGGTSVQIVSADTAGDAQVQIVDFAFSSKEVPVKAGQTVVWTNGGSVGHTTTSDKNEWDSSTLSPSKRYAVKFTAPGSFAFHCNIHPSMKAAVTVS